MQKYLLVTSLLIFSKLSLTAGLIGGYNIGPTNADYPTIDLAVQDLNTMGIDGDVTFNIDPLGNYTQRFTINNFPNVNNHHVAFISSSPSLKAVLNVAGVSAANYTININGAANIKFENILFNNQSSVYKGIIEFNQNGGNTPKNIEFSKCQFMVSNGGVSINGNVIHTNCVLNNIDINNSFFSGGYDCINLENASTYSYNIKIEKDTFSSHDHSAVQLKFVKSFTLVDSKFNNGNNMGNTLGVRLEYSDDTTTISRNQFIENAMQLWNCANTTAGNKWISIDNNFITCSSLNPLELTNVSGLGEINIIHNTITSSSTSVLGFYGTMAHLHFMNNLCIQFNSVNNVLQKNGNQSDFHFNHNAYIYPNQFALVSMANTTFTQWQTAQLLDANSIDDHGLAWDPSWGAFKEYPNCHFPSKYKIALFVDKDFENDLSNIKRNFYPSWVGCTNVGKSNNSLGIISGTVKAGNNTLTNGEVSIYADNTNKIMLDLVATTTISNLGFFSFNNLPNKEYALKFTPDKINDPAKIPTYYGGKFNWGTVFPMNADSCSTGISLDFQVDTMETMASGAGKISGYVTYDLAGTKTSDPIPGIDIVLDKIPPSKSVNMTTTDAYGYYEFNNLSMGDYQIKIDFTGLDNDSLYMVTLDNNNSEYSTMDYCVDTNVIANICGAPASVKSIEKKQNKNFSVLPNPFNNELQISTLNTFKEILNITIYDLAGRIIQNSSASNSTSYKINTSNLESGIYIIGINHEGVQENYKVIKE